MVNAAVFSGDGFQSTYYKPVGHNNHDGQFNDHHRSEHTDAFNPVVSGGGEGGGGQPTSTHNLHPQVE